MTFIKTNFIPYIDDENNLITSKEIVDEDRITEEYLDTICKFIDTFFPKIKDSNNPDELTILLDCIVLLVNGNLEPQYGKAAYSLVHVLLKQHGVSAVNALKEFFLLDFQKRSSYSNKIQSFLNVAADTRPGLSASSLWFHMMMTSAFATSSYLTYNLKNKEIDESYQLEKHILSDVVKIRFAALFHDIGKPIKRRDHVNASCDIFTKRFSEILDSDFMSEILDIIRAHHKKDAGDSLANFVRRADKAVSSVDRVTEILIDVISDKHEYEWIKDQQEFSNWKKWNELSVEQKREISTSFVKEFYRKKKQPQSQTQSDKNQVTGEDRIALVRGESRHIHDFISGNTLNQVKGASAKLANSLLNEPDNHNSAWRILCKLQLPMENIIYSGGGNIVFLSDIPRVTMLKSRVKRGFLQTVNQKTDFIIAHNSFPIYISDKSSKIDFASHYRLLSGKIRKMKMDLLNYQAKPLYLGYSEFCASCMESPAIRNVENPQQTENYCKACKEIDEYGYQIAFKSVYEDMDGEEITGMPWYRINSTEPFMGKLVTEFIAGHTISELEEYEKNRSNVFARDIAYISADGNNMGLFFSNVVSINEMAEKSALSRKIMNKVFEKSIQIIKSRVEEVAPETFRQKEAELMELRIRLGKLYSAGDDIEYLLPGFLGIPFLLLISREFYKEFGGPITDVALSGGVVTDSPRRPITQFQENASDLLKQSKYLSRTIEAGKGVLYFDYEVLKTGSYGQQVSQNRKKLGKSMLTTRPLLMERLGDKKFFEFLSFATVDPVNSIEDLIDFSLKYYYFTIKYDEKRLSNQEKPEMSAFGEKIDDLFRTMRTVLQKIDFSAILNGEINYKDAIFNALIFSSYKKAKEQKKSDKVTKKVEEYTKMINMLLPAFEDDTILLLDVYLLLEQLRGGH